MIKVRFGVNQKVGKKYLHQNGKLTLRCAEHHPNLHNRVIAGIRKQYPGWNITGWVYVKSFNN
jgi:hypothetical protein